MYIIRFIIGSIILVVGLVLAGSPIATLMQAQFDMSTMSDAEMTGTMLGFLMFFIPGLLLTGLGASLLRK